MLIRQFDDPIWPTQGRRGDRLSVHTVFEADDSSLSGRDPCDPECKLTGLHSGGVDAADPMGGREEALHQRLGFPDHGSWKGARNPYVTELRLYSTYDVRVGVTQERRATASEEIDEAISVVGIQEVVFRTYDRKLR